MKRALAWFAGLVGIAALGRWLASRTRAGRHEQGQATETAQQQSAPVAAPVEAEHEPEDDPAEELRRRLVQAREAQPDAGEAGEAVEAEPETLEQRRARVHAQAQQVIDAMADDGTGR